MHIFGLQNCIWWHWFGTLTVIFDVLEEIIRKSNESWYIGIFPIINKIIDIPRRLPQIIGDLKELSARLLTSKMTGKLSKKLLLTKITYRTTLAVRRKVLLGRHIAFYANKQTNKQTVEKVWNVLDVTLFNTFDGNGISYSFSNRIIHWKKLGDKCHVTKILCHFTKPTSSIFMKHYTSKK